jgi:hypothetical protein
VYSGTFRLCLDEAKLAAFLARELAFNAGEHLPERHSHATLKTQGGFTASTFIVATFLIKKLWVLTVPYVVIFGAYWWSYRDLGDRLNDETVYMSLRFMHQAGYDLNGSVEYWTAKMQEEENDVFVLQLLERNLTPEVRLPAAAFLLPGN